MARYPREQTSGVQECRQIPPRWASCVPIKDIISDVPRGSHDHAQALVVLYLQPAFLGSRT